MVLASNNLVNPSADEVISAYYSSKYAFYSNLLYTTSKEFEDI